MLQGGLLMGKNEELRWMTKSFSWRYIPLRYQALVATIVSALLYFNLFQILFSPRDAGNFACGTFLRPVRLSLDNTDPVGWLWDSNPFTLSETIRCPRTMQALWWEWFASFGGLAICGLVLRRAIKREQANG